MPMRIMLVEDNPGDVELLRMSLDRGEFPYVMNVFSDGAEAIAGIRQLNNVEDGTTLPSVIVLDLNLPKYDGLEVLSEVRSYPKLAEIPVTILTSSSAGREHLPVRGYSHVLYLTKPSDLDEYLGLGTIIKDFVASEVISR
jgi:two-component system response regulator